MVAGYQDWTRIHIGRQGQLILLSMMSYEEFPSEQYTNALSRAFGNTPNGVGQQLALKEPHVRDRVHLFGGCTERVEGQRTRSGSPGVQIILMAGNRKMKVSAQEHWGKGFLPSSISKAAEYGTSSRE